MTDDKTTPSRESIGCKSYVIEFRNGSYFQNLDAERGGPLATAQRFAREAAVREFTTEHEWILWNGGMAVAVPDNA